MSKRSGKQISGDPRKRSQRIDYPKTRVNAQIFSERLSDCSSYDDLCKIYIDVNYEIDRISDNPFKMMGGMSKNYKSMSSKFQMIGFSYDDFKATVEDEIRTLNYLEKLDIGGTLFRTDGSGEMFPYKKVC